MHRRVCCFKRSHLTLLPAERYGAFPTGEKVPVDFLDANRAVTTFFGHNGVVDRGAAAIVDPHSYGLVCEP